MENEKMWLVGAGGGTERKMVIAGGAGRRETSVFFFFLKKKVQEASFVPSGGRRCLDVQVAGGRKRGRGSRVLGPLFQVQLFQVQPAAGLWVEQTSW